MTVLADTPDLYGHLRTVIGVGLSLSLARLLTGLAQFVQHPRRRPVYGVHLGWVAFMILEVLHFWWFEFSLGLVHAWTFERFVFVVAFASVHFVLATILFPDDLWEYGTLRAYFNARKTWFLGLLLLLLFCDQVDTILKGAAHYKSLGPSYPIKQAFIALMAIAAIFVDREWFQRLAVGSVLAAEVVWLWWHNVWIG